jgi:hypothetical protein
MLSDENATSGTPLNGSRLLVTESMAIARVDSASLNKTGRVVWAELLIKPGMMVAENKTEAASKTRTKTRLPSLFIGS